MKIRFQPMLIFNGYALFRLGRRLLLPRRHLCPPQWRISVLIQTPANYEPAAANVVYITSVQPNRSKLQIGPFPGAYR